MVFNVTSDVKTLPFMAKSLLEEKLPKENVNEVVTSLFKVLQDEAADIRGGLIAGRTCEMRRAMCSEQSLYSVTVKTYILLFRRLQQALLHECG